jgi:hypothetical protein
MESKSYVLRLMREKRHAPRMPEAPPRVVTRELRPEMLEIWRVDRWRTVLRPRELNAYLQAVLSFDMHVNGVQGDTPSGPQQEAAQSYGAVAVRLEPSVNRLAVGVEAAETRPKEDGTCERNGAAYAVHVGAAAEVHEAYEMGGA